MCEIWDGDFEPAKVSRRTEHCARKQHRCTGCGASIAVGDRYAKYVWIGSSGVDTERACGVCEALNKRFAEAHGFAWMPPSSLADWLVECSDDDNNGPWGEDLEALLQRRAVAREARGGAA